MLSHDVRLCRLTEGTKATLIGALCQESDIFSAVQQMLAAEPVITLDDIRNINTVGDNALRSLAEHRRCGKVQPAVTPS